LVQGYDERTNVMGIRALFGLLGTLAAAGLSFPLLGSRMQYGRYPLLGLLFGAAMSATGLLTVFGTWDRRAGPSGAAVKASFADFFRQLTSSLRSRSFRAIWCSTTLFFLAVVVNAALAVHYFTWYARISKGTMVGGIQVSFYLGAVAGVIIWMALARRSEKRGLYLTAMLGTAALLAMASLLVGEGHLFGIGHPLPLIVGHAAAGLFASALWVVPPSMIADVADEDALAGGARREGIFYGMQNFGEKIASGGALLITGVLLSVFVKLAPASAAQSPTAVTRLGLLYGLLPGAMLVAAAALIFPYQLDRRRVSDIQRRLGGEKRG
jgi:GPH family glycoside/pentoside/hexuronide:cation symporter